VEKVLKTLVLQSPRGSKERVQGSPDSVTPFFETLYYFPDEKTRLSSETRAKITDTFLSFVENVWHPLQRVDEDGVPKVFDILNTFIKFLSVFDEAKAAFNSPNLIFEEVNVAFTLYVNWLNHSRLVNFTRVLLYRI
jgi:hypothetical protein